MTTSFDSIATLSEQELLDHFTSLVERDRRITAALLVAIAEIDDRKIWAKHACSSMFTFCMERFQMSEQVTAKRLWAARTARRFPVILEMVERGDLHLGAIHLLAKHLTAENHVRVLERAKHKSSRDVERLVAELAPRADVASRIRAMPRARVEGPAAAARSGADSASRAKASVDSDQAMELGDRQPLTRNETVVRASDRQSARTADSRGTERIVPLSPRRFKIEITVDESTHDKLRSLQDLLGRSETSRDPAAIISRAIDVLLVRTLARKAGCTSRTAPRTSTSETSQREPRSSPASAANAEGSKTSQHETARSDDAAASQRARRTRTIPAAVRREVWRRDCGRCCYVDASAHRCRETRNVEFHHKNPFAAGGPHTSENVELRCAAHNQYQADLDFGRSFMDRRRERIVTCAAFPGECSTRAAASCSGAASAGKRRGTTASSSCLDASSPAAP